MGKNEKERKIRRALYYLDEAAQIVNWLPETQAYEAKLAISEAMKKLRAILEQKRIDF